MLHKQSYNRYLLAGAALALGTPLPAAAQDALFSGEIVMELQNEYTADSDDPATDGYNNMFFRTEIAPTLRLNENFFIDGVAVVEGIQDRDPDESNYFDNEGVFIEEIKLNYENGAWAAWAGKFNPGFGMAWDYGRGIWSEDFAEDYEMTEKIGAGGSYTFSTASMGAHTLALSSFFADTTFLSGSAVTKRDKLSLGDGGVSNTQDFSSFVASLEGENLAGVENLYYKLGYRNQSEGDKDDDTVDRETGYVVTLGHVFPVTENLELDALAEYVDLRHFEGGTDDNQYYTGSVIARFHQNWNVTATFTAKNVDVQDDSDINDRFVQISAGYDFGRI